MKPRDELIDLNNFNYPGQYSLATWEGCVVKISDKIAYIGRDIEDAITLGFLNEKAQNELRKFAQINDEKAMNSTVIMHNLIIDICENSSPEKGICLSDKLLDQLDTIKKYNYEHIYTNKRFETFKKYAELVLNQLFDTLFDQYDGRHTFNNLESIKKYYPSFVHSFETWLARYCDFDIDFPELQKIALMCENTKIYGMLDTKEIYAQAVIDYISGMTDRFAVKSFNELITYQ